MRFHVLACDYDGTLALHGQVDSDTVAALERLLASGRKLLLVTGRELDELMGIFPHLNFFSWVVAENGALLYSPATKEERKLAETPPAAFIDALRKRGVAPMSVGRVIVATWRPHEKAVLEAIQEAGLELQVIFNKDAVMVLPAGVNKASGLSAALDQLGLSPHEVVAVGDAENDHAFLNASECGVAVANALPAVKDRADVVTKGDHGAGVIELIERITGNALGDVDLHRHDLVLGTRADGEEARFTPYGTNLLIAGPSGSGKSTAATSFLERLAEKRYQYCIIDPEGDYDTMTGTATVGSSAHGPTVDEVLQLLASPQQNIVVNLVGMALGDRPPFFLKLLPRLQEMRARTGRPHWLIVDEAHHLMPTTWEPGPQVLPDDLKRTLFITVHPGQVAPGMLKSVDTVIAVGGQPEDTVRQFLEAMKEDVPKLPAYTLEKGEVLLWRRETPREPMVLRLIPSTTERRRHTRKYAEGELPPERSFYFQGPDKKLNLRAQNLILFMQLADGVDDATWEHHRKAGDYSRWFAKCIKDKNLAAGAADIEGREGLTPKESRAQMRALIEQYYTLPGGPPLPMPGTDAEPVHQ